MDATDDTTTEPRTLRVLYCDPATSELLNTDEALDALRSAAVPTFEAA